MVVAPVVVMPPAIAADPARSVISPDHPATVRVVVIGRRIIEMPVKVVPVCEPMSTKAAVEDMTGTKSAAVEGRTAAMEAAASAVKSATTVVAPAMAATVTAMATSDFGRQPVGSVFRRRH